MPARRALIRGLVGLIVLAPGITIAQRAPSRVTRIAILSSGWDRDRPIFVAFRRRLRELGYEEGYNVQLMFYFPSAREPLSALAQAIVRESPDVALADGSIAARALAVVTRNIPIVAVTGDPVARGLAASLARPGGNVTGISTISDELIAKEIELISQIIPTARRVGLADAGIVDAHYLQLEQRSASMGISLRRITVRSKADAEREITPAALRDVEALVFPPSAVFGSISASLARLIAVASKPAIFGDRDFVAAGGLVFYGINIEDAFRRSAELVDRIIKGAIPAETPFEQPSRIELVINLRTAKALRLSIPQSLVLRADQVIE
jgi:putative ABC transport system substrate-binding protein